jgi:Tetracyclin repressor-like, C-terminal domain
MTGVLISLWAAKQAQRDGHVSDRWSPAELLLLIISISTIWMFATPGLAELGTTAISERRRTVTEAVQLLVDDPTGLEHRATYKFIACRSLSH